MEEKKIRLKPERLKPLVHGNIIYKSSDDCSLSRQDYEKAYRELGETEHGRAVALETLRENIENDKSIKYCTDDNYLLRYLRHTKYDVEKAYKMLRRFFYIFRKKHPHVFSTSNLEKLISTRYWTYLPYTDEDGCIYFWLNFRNWDLQEMNAWDLVSVYHAMADILTLNPNYQIHGMKQLWDMRGLTINHIGHVMKPSTIVFLMNTMQNSYPYRLKKLVFIHANPMLQAAYNACYLLLKKKIRDRFVILGSDISELHKYLNMALLPKEYGGTLEEEECYATHPHVLANLDYLKYERTAFGPVK